MGSEIGINAEAARKIQDAGSEFKVPSASRDELRALSREQWMERFGDVLASEQYFEQRDPDWSHNPQGWWHREVGRDGSDPPLWMRTQWHMPELDCPAGKDRQQMPLEQRAERPLWAERMGLSGKTPTPQATTVYGHRREYLPTQKTDARSMYERYQPAYQRIVDEEIPDTADPPDGRFWTAGVAQGVTTNPYERRLAISGRRKPMVIGPRSIAVVVDGEGHTLANAVRDVAWLHPHVEFAGYSLEHPVYRHMNLRVQTASTSNIGGEQALAESLELTQTLFDAVDKAMDEGMSEWPGRKAELERQRQQERAEMMRRSAEREALMQRWMAMTEGIEAYDEEVEKKLFGKVRVAGREAA